MFRYLSLLRDHCNPFLIFASNFTWVFGDNVPFQYRQYQPDSTEMSEILWFRASSAVSGRPGGDPGYLELFGIAGAVTFNLRPFSATLVEGLLPPLALKPGS